MTGRTCGRRALGAVADRVGVVSAFWVVPAILAGTAVLLVASWRTTTP